MVCASHSRYLMPPMRRICMQTPQCIDSRCSDNIIMHVPMQV